MTADNYLIGEYSRISYRPTFQTADTICDKYRQDSWVADTITDITDPCEYHIFNTPLRGFGRISILVYWNIYRRVCHVVCRQLLRVEDGIQVISNISEMWGFRLAESCGKIRRQRQVVGSFCDATVGLLPTCSSPLLQGVPWGRKVLALDPVGPNSAHIQELSPICFRLQSKGAPWGRCKT